jgi:hypothetical protein
METLKSLTDIFQNIVTAIAAIVAGLWVLNRLKRERTDEAALEMTLTSQATQNPARAPSQDYLVLFTVQLANKGKTKIEAKSERKADGSVFNDGPERLIHSCSLQIRELHPGVASPQHLDWFEGPWVDIFYGDRAINVLVDYYNPNKRDAESREKLEFWMEPGETYRMGVPVILPQGMYVAKLTFVGADQKPGEWDRFLGEMGLVDTQPPDEDQNFWSQIYGFTVPGPAEKSSAMA